MKCIEEDHVCSSGKVQTPNSIRNASSYIADLLVEAISKMSFGPPAFGGIGAFFQILDNQQVACGLKLGPAAIWNQNLIFEMTSKK